VRSASAPRDRSRLFEELYEDSQITREKIAKKQEMAKKQEVEGCTFAPNLRRHRSKLVELSPDGGDADPRAGKSEEEVGLRACFPPLSNSRYAHGLPPRTSPHVQAPVFDRLSYDKAAALALREEMKKQQELTGCTFQPHVNRPHRSRSSTPRGLRSGDANGMVNDENVFSRLEGHMDYERKAKLKEERELAKCTFKPRLVHRKSGDYSAKNGPHAGKTIFERLKHEAQERKERELLRAKMRVEMEREGCTFKPQINTSSPHTGTPIARTSSRRTFDDTQPVPSPREEPVPDGDHALQRSSPRSNPQSQSPGKTQGGGSVRGRNFSDQFEEIQRISSPVGVQEDGGHDGEAAEATEAAEPVRQPEGRGRTAVRERGGSSGSPRHLQPTISSRSKSPRRTHSTAESPTHVDNGFFLGGQPTSHHAPHHAPPSPKGKSIPSTHTKSTHHTNKHKHRSQEADATSRIADEGDVEGGGSFKDWEKSMLDKIEGL